MRPNSKLLGGLTFKKKSSLQYFEEKKRNRKNHQNNVIGYVWILILIVYIVLRETMIFLSIIFNL